MDFLIYFPCNFEFVGIHGGIKVFSEIILPETNFHHIMFMCICICAFVCVYLYFHQMILQTDLGARDEAEVAALVSSSNYKHLSLCVSGIPPMKTRLNKYVCFFVLLKTLAIIQI